MLKFEEGSFLSGGRFLGLDLSRRAEDLSPGGLVAASNFVLDGEDLLTRPGRDGQFSSPLANPIRALTPMDVGAVFVSGGASTGKLYYWAPGVTAPTEIQLPGSTSLARTVAGVQLAQAVSVGFLVDGVGTLVRFTTSAASAQTELDRPATAPVGTVYHETLSTLYALATTQNTITGATTIPAASGAGDTIAPMSSVTWLDGDFWHSGATSGTAFWNTRTGAPAYSPNIQDGNGGNAVELDSDTGPGDSVLSDAIVLNPASVLGYAKVAVVSYEAAAEDATTNSQVVDLDVTVFSDAGGTTPITGSTKTWRSPFLANDASKQMRQLVDLRGLATAPRSIKVGFTQPVNANTNQGADVNRVAVYIPEMKLGLVADPDNRLSVRQGTVQVWHGLGATPTLAGAVGGTTDPQSAVPGRLLTSGLQVGFTLASAQNWTGVRTVGLEVIPGAGVKNIALRVGFKVSSTWFYTDAMDIPTPSSSETSGRSFGASPVWAIGALRDVAASLTAVTDIRVELLSDVFVDGLQDGGDAVIFRLGELRNVGNLPEGFPVWYKLVEMDEAGDGANLLDVVYSDGSPSTALVAASRGSRMGRLVLPARTNSGAEWFALYRFGGDYISQNGETAQGRLLCLVSWAAADFAFGADTDKGASPRIVAFGNPYISWDKTGSTGAVGSILIDNTPDSWLSGADTYLSGREKAPTAPDAIAEWDKRLWLGDGSDLFASWLLNANATAGVYWTRLQLPEISDPAAAIKGHWEKLMLAAGDSIQRMIALPDNLIVLTKQRVYRVSRSDKAVPAYFVERITDANAQGVIAPWAACEMDKKVWWLTLSGLRVSDGSSVGRTGDELHSYLVKTATASDLALARMSACPRTRKIFLAVGGKIYVYHAGRSEDGSLERGWTTWESCDSLLACEILGVLYLAGETSGQIWAMTQAQDDSGPIAASMTTRRFHEGGNNTLVPTRLLLNVVAETTEALSLTVTGGSSALRAEISQSVPVGEWDWSMAVDHTAEGPHLSVTVALAAAARFRIRGLALEATSTRRV